jgi:hypothetical protein
LGRRNEVATESTSAPEECASEKRAHEKCANEPDFWQKVEHKANFVIPNRAESPVRNLLFGAHPPDSSPDETAE